METNIKDLFNVDLLLWNSRSLESKKATVSSLFAKIPILAFTEANITKDFKLSPFVAYLDQHHNPRSKTSIFVHKKIPQAPFPLDCSASDFHFSAVHIGGTSSFILICCYVTTKVRNISAILSELLQQCTSPVIFCGDFNSHNSLWGSVKTDKRGRDIESFLSDSNLLLLNDGSPTFTRPGYYSHLDLSFASSSLADRTSWSVFGDTLGSDHFPVCHSGLLAKTPRFFRKNCTNWNTFSSLVAVFWDSKAPTNFDDLQSSMKECLSEATTTRVCLAGQNIPSAALTYLLQRKLFLQKRLRRTGDLKLCLELKKLQAKIRRTALAERRKSWKNFCSALDASSPTGTVWTKIRSINGSPAPSQPSQALVTKLQLSYQDAANLLLDTFFPDPSSNRAASAPDNASGHTEQSTKGYRQAVAASSYILGGKRPASSVSGTELTPVKLLRLSQLRYESSVYTVHSDDLFQLQELTDVLLAVKRSSHPGPDRIPYSALTSLPHRCKLQLLDLYNSVWTTAVIPSVWNLADIVPIWKPGKPTTELTSYRPISLSSAPLKVMERMVLKRLQAHLDRVKALPEQFYGFRQRSSTMDCLIEIVSSADVALAKGKIMGCVFLDLKSAFDTADHLAILHKSKNLGVEGRLLNFLEAFLDSRYVQVKLGPANSSTRKLRRGVPQGSVLSPTLFNILLHDLATCFSRLLEYVVYADDIAFWIIGNNFNIVFRLLQQALNNIANFCRRWGLVPSPEKTKIMFFTRKQVPSTSPLTLDNAQIEVVNNHTYLGIKLDNRLTWREHSEYVTDCCKRRLNIIKALSNKNWGTGTKRLLQFYKAFCLSKLRYGLPAIINASNSALDRMEKVHRQGLRLCLGLPQHTKISIVHALAGVPELRQLQYLDLDTFFTKKCIQSSHHRLLRKLQTIASSSDIGRFLASEANAPKATPLQLSPPLIWKLRSPKIITRIPGLSSKRDIPVSAAKALFELYSEDLNCRGLCIYTDGSYDQRNGIAGAAFHIPALQTSFAYRVDGCMSSTKAELFAIKEALTWASLNSTGPVTIFTDSRSALMLLKGRSIHWEWNPLALHIIWCCHALLETQRPIQLCWVPGHSNVEGNTVADAAAKLGTLFQVPHLTALSLNEQIFSLKACFSKRWKSTWNTDLQLLHGTTISKTLIFKELNLTRAWETCLFRLLSGNALTKSTLYKMKKSQDNRCDFCNKHTDSLTHFLFDCDHFNSQRETHRTALAKHCITWTLNNLLGLDGNVRNFKMAFGHLKKFIISSGRFI